MNSKGLKVLAYIFFTAAIIWFVLIFNKVNDLWANIVKSICLGILLLIVLIFILLLIFCIHDNKKIDKMLDVNDYDCLIEYCKKMKNKKWFLLYDRKFYYEYLILLGYVGKDDDKNIVESYKNFTKMDYFPMTYYWKACYDFSKGNLENIDNYYQNFIQHPDVYKKANHFKNIILIFESLDLYVKQDYQKAKETLKKVDITQINMPSTLKSISMINEEITES